MSIDNYLSQYGINEFTEWYEGIPEFNSIKCQIEELKKLIITGNSILNYNTINTIKNTIKKMLILQYEIYYKQNPETDFNNWIDSIKQYCFQGGYGYCIRYLGAPHHLCIKPEYYNLCFNIPKNILLCSIILNKYLEIDNTPTLQKWSS